MFSGYSACSKLLCFWYLLTCINTPTTNYEYSRSNRENLPLPIQRQLSEKLKRCFQFFIAFLEFTLNLKHFEKKEPHSSSISEFIDIQRRAYLNVQKVLFLKTLP